MTGSSLKFKSNVLITGGSGLVGRYLTSVLLERGYSVAHLSRIQDQFGRVRVYRWDPVRGILDPMVLDGVDYIIHLAVAGIGEKRWSEKRRKEIVSSRVDSALLLHRIVSENNVVLKAFISASAVGYYGSATTDKIYTEQDQPASDFLASTCRQWEGAADAFEKSGTRTVKIRSAVVLDKNDSALSRLMMPAKFGFLVRLGSGRQYMPWIHIKDLCGIYLKAIEDPNLSGAVNAVSPQHVSHHEFIKALSSKMKKPVFPVNVPSFILS
ncbi:MAG: TIGR01777 family oxidoreductase, partial [Bacteroidia bacterium]|nr:TIGR01777 family oxidoreductase [Bacteroidia bacterium]